MSEILRESSITIKKNFSLSFGDFKVISFCYVPIVGTDALGLYNFLIAKGDATSPFCFGEELFNYTGLNEATCDLARRKLEAVGLLETYHKGNGEDTDSFFLEVIPPLSAKKFFSDPALSSLLIDVIGYKNHAELQRIFVNHEKVDSSFDKETVPLGAMFNLEKEDLSLYTDKNVDEMEEKKGKLSGSGFDLDKLKAELSKSGIPYKSIESSIDDIKSCASFFSLGYEDIAALISSSTNSENIFSYKIFLSLCHAKCRFLTDSFTSDSVDETIAQGAKATWFKHQDETSIPAFFCERLGISKAPDKTLDDLMALQKDFGFSNGVVNNIIDYCYLINHGEFPSIVYLQKIALSVAGKNPRNAYECSVFLVEQNKKIKKSFTKKKMQAAGIKNKREEIQSEPEVKSNKPDNADSDVLDEKDADMLKKLLG